MWECGLKRYLQRYAPVQKLVTPYVGVWIETYYAEYNLDHKKVTPYVGVWIETQACESISRMFTSLLMWECGLKQQTISF